MTVVYSPRSQCIGKVPYYAKAFARDAEKRNEQRLGVRLRKYKCPHCGHWHIGNRVAPEHRPEA